MEKQNVIEITKEAITFEDGNSISNIFSLDEGTIAKEILQRHIDVWHELVPSVFEVKDA